MKKTELYDFHKIELKAKMAPFAGYEMPLQYSSAKEEIQAVRKSAGAFDVSHMGELFVSGAETAEFINYLITNDYKKLPIGKAIYSPICNENGGILDDLIVYKLHDQKALICVNAANIEQDWNWAKSQSSSFNVNIENLSDKYSLIALQGPESEKILKNVFPDLVEDIENCPYYGVFESTKHQIIVARTGYTGEDGFEVFALNKDAKNLWSNILREGATPCGLASRDTLRLEVCYPLYGKELDVTHNPKESSLAWTLKKNEENYIGKDLIEKNGISSKIIKLSLEKLIPREGYKVFAGEEEIGFVTSGTFSPTLSQGISMARVKNLKNLKDQDLLIEIRGKKYPAKYQTQAFYAGGIKK